MRRTLSALAALVVAVSLAGCAVEITDPQSSAPPASTEPEAMASAAPRPSPSATRADPEEISDAGGATITRADMIAAAESTIACTPGLVIDQDGAVVVVEGACEQVTVNADVAVVVVDDVARVRVAGTGNVVSALSVKTLEVVGDINTIWWRGDAPDVTDTGVGNTLVREP